MLGILIISMRGRPESSDHYYHVLFTSRDSLNSSKGLGTHVFEANERDGDKLATTGSHNEQERARAC